MTSANSVNEARRLVELRKTHPVTPFKADEWELLLRHFRLLDKYPNIPRSIRQGFDVGIGRIERTMTPRNSGTLEEYPEAYREIIDKEFQTGRYMGPYSKAVVEAVLGPFQTSPLSLIPKPSKPGKYRAVHNFSHPYVSSSSNPPSINDNIDPDQYSCTFGTFDIVSHIIYHLPRGSEASTRDVSEAYRTVPVVPTQWPGLVVRLSGEDSYAINTNNNFGLASAGGVFGKIADAAADIFRAAGIGPVCKWVDDYILFRVPRQHIDSYNNQRAEWRREIERNGTEPQTSGGRMWFRGDTMPNDQDAEFDEDMTYPVRDCSMQSPRSLHDSLFSYSDEDIDTLSQRLGIPWENTKTTPFFPVVKYIGFMWDLCNRTVSLPRDKRMDYLQDICEWQEKSTHTLEDVQKLYGKLLHASTIIPAGRAYMTNFENMMSEFSSDTSTAERQAPREVANDLTWWMTTLCGEVERDVPGPYNVVDLEAYSDASTDTGIAITIGRRWRAWRLIPGWNAEQRDILWAEAVAFEFLARTLCTMITPGTHVRVHGDNQGVVEGWLNGRSRNKPTNIVFRRIHDVAAAHRCTFLTRFVRSEQNRADGPSRGVYPPVQDLLPRISIPSELRRFVVDSHQ